MRLADAMDVLGGPTQGLVTAQQLQEAGCRSPDVTRAMRRGAVVRVRPHVYALEDLPLMPRHVVTEDGVSSVYARHVRAVLLSMGSSATAVGRTAAALRGWGMLVEPARTVDVGVPHGRSRARARHVRVVQRRRLVREAFVTVVDADAMWVTTAVQTAVDCCLALPRLEAVVILDSALRAGSVTMRQLRSAAQRLPGHDGADRVRQVLAWLDPESGSVLESVLRYRLLAAGLCGFATQLDIADPRTVRDMRVDFCFADLGLVVEADGTKWHQQPERDRLRDNALARLGFRVLRYTWREVVHDPTPLVAEIAAACAAGRPDFQNGNSTDALAA